VCVKKEKRGHPEPGRLPLANGGEGSAFRSHKVNDPDVEQLSMVHECSKSTPSAFLHKRLDVTIARRISAALYSNDKIGVNGPKNQHAFAPFRIRLKLSAS
jgi:hypothetical protein